MNSTCNRAAPSASSASINSWPIRVRMGCVPRPLFRLFSPSLFLSMLKYWTSWSWGLYRKLSAGLAGGRKGVTGAHSSAQLTTASMLPFPPVPSLPSPCHTSSSSPATWHALMASFNLGKCAAKMKKSRVLTINLPRAAAEQMQQIRRQLATCNLQPAEVLQALAGDVQSVFTACPKIAPTVAAAVGVGG